MLKLLARHLVIVAGLIAVIFAWIDTADYRRVIEDAAAKVSAHGGDKAADEMYQDIARINACHQGQRDCVIAALQQNTTTTGAIAGAVTATDWLATHPADAGVRDAARAAIARARDRLIAAKPWYFDSLDRIAAAKNNSFVLRHFGSEQAMDGAATFAKIADDLDRAEFGVVRPDIAAQQMEWRRKAAAGGAAVAGINT